MEFIIEMSDFVIQSKIVYLSNEYALQTIPKLPTEVSFQREAIWILCSLFIPVMDSSAIQKQIC